MRSLILLIAIALVGCETPFGLQVPPDRIIIDQFVSPAIYSDRSCYQLGHQAAFRQEKIDQLHEQLQRRADNLLSEEYSATQLYIRLKSELEAVEYVIRDKGC